MTKRLWKIGVLLLLAIVLLAGWCTLPAHAANPGTISFQGKITNANGTNVADGTYGFVFKLYSVSSGGTAVWTESDSLSVSAGVFQVNLGASSSLSGINFSTASSLYLGITFNGDPAGEMSPRVQLQSVPYAFNADNASNLGGVAASSYAQLGGTQQTGSINVTGSGTFGNTLKVTTGSVTIGSFGTGVVHSSSAGLLSSSAVVLGTDTSGSYVANLGTLTGLSTSGNSGAGSTPTLSVQYGSGINTAVQGSTTLTCPSGSGNLTGTGNVITLGSGGTCNAIGISSSPTFSGTVTGAILASNGDITSGGRLYVQSTTSTNGQGYFIRNATPNTLAGYQALDLGGSTYGFLDVNKYYNGTAWVDDGLGRVGSSFQIQNDNFTFYSFDTGTTFTPRLTVASGGNVGVATTTPTSLFSVGTASQFQVNSSGAIVAVTGISNSGGYTQSGATANTFTGDTNFTGSGTGLSVTNAATIGNGLTVSAGGAGITGNLTASGLLTANGGATINGGVINLNASSNFAVNIGTGTTTGAISIGGGSDTFALNSTALDISTAGAVTGATNITASGTITAATINATSNFQANGTPGVDFTCGNNQYANQLAVNNGIVTGHSACSGVGLSDQRLKTNITSLGAGTLDQLAQVNPVNFYFDCSNSYFTTSDTYCQPGLQTGVIAQQLQAIFPQLVSQDEWGYYHVDYQGLSVEALKGVGELAQHIDSAGHASFASVIAPSLTSSGALSLDSGSTGDVSIDTGSAAAINIGTDQAAAVSLSRPGHTTTVNGGLVVNQSGDFSGDVRVGGSLAVTGGGFSLADSSGHTVISFDQSGSATFTGNLNLASASLSGGLSVGGDVSVGGLSTFQKLATFLAKTVFRQDVEFDGHITVASDSAGYAALRSGESTVHISFTNPYENPPVVTASIVNGQFGLVSVNNVTAQGFDLSLSQAAPADTTLSWTAIGVNNPQTASNPVSTP
ncbi:MAG TPA: tail fiber domain-containing protein [Candidatus Saccharimonadales bacterium]|nr:tail fiber domain-containing protein [Candidatus Saccharimonadales bacterium]